MKFSEETAQAILTNPRYSGVFADSQATLKRWRNRKNIPDIYFSPQYVALMKEGKEGVAENVPDRFFNPDYLPRISLSDEEQKIQEKLIFLFGRYKKINGLEFLRQEGVRKSAILDASRTDGKAVDISATDIAKLRNAVQTLRAKVKNTLTVLELKSIFSENDLAKIDEIFADKRLIVMPIIEGDSRYRGRITSRKLEKPTPFEQAEVIHYVKCLKTFMLETAL